MPHELYTKAIKALADRSIWEQRQRVWYTMRHDGLRRKRKPFPGASDLHFPLIDTCIEKIKPFYYNQFRAGERLAHFVALNEQLQEATASAADYFDYTLNQETNLEREMLSGIDTMCLRSMFIMRVIYDPFRNKVAFEAIDPLFFIVPGNAPDEVKEMDWFIHVKHVTVGAYKRDRRYNQDAGVINRLRGNISPGTQQQEQEAASREGLTFVRDPNVIVIWEGYTKTMGGWTVETFCPTQQDIVIRKPFGIPYKWQGETICPFVRFSMEVKDKGWYAPRGLGERLAPFEASMVKQWNEKHDYMSFVNKPLFTSKNPMQNTANMRFQPGEFIPGDTTIIAMPNLPTSFDEDMRQTQNIGEESVAMPDASLSSDEVGQEKATATEINYRKALSSTGVDLKGRVFRMALGDLYKCAWAMLVQYRREDLTYFTSDDRQVLAPQALHDNYLISPDGSPDQWAKAQRIQKAMTRFQIFAQDPNVDHEGLVKDVLAADDPRLIKTLFMPTGQKDANEAKDEAVDIILLMSGYPAPVNPGENHALRLKIIFGKLQQLGQSGAPVDPVAKQRLHDHAMMHLMYLRQQNPAMAKQITSAIQQFDNSAGFQVGQNKPQQNVVPMPQSQATPQPAMPIQ